MEWRYRSTNAFEFVVDWPLIDVNLPSISILLLFPLSRPPVGMHYMEIVFMAMDARSKPMNVLRMFLENKFIGFLTSNSLSTIFDFSLSFY